MIETLTEFLGLGVSVITQPAEERILLSQKDLHILQADGEDACSDVGAQSVDTLKKIK